TKWRPGWSRSMTEMTCSLPVVVKVGFARLESPQAGCGWPAQQSRPSGRVRCSARWSAAPAASAMRSGTSSFGGFGSAGGGGVGGLVEEQGGAAGDVRRGAAGAVEELAAVQRDADRRVGVGHQVGLAAAVLGGTEGRVRREALVGGLPCADGDGAAAIGGH